MIKTRYRFKGDIDPDVFMELLTGKESLWNKELTLNEEIASSGDWTFYRYIIRPPTMFSDLMYFVEKRLLFEDQGTHYGYYSSAPDSMLVLSKGYTWCQMIFGDSVLKKEGNEYAYYFLSKVDVHINGLIRSIIARYISSKSKGFMRSLQEYSITFNVY